MAVFKVTENPCDTELALQNVCSYIIDEKKTAGMIGGRGIRPLYAFEDMLQAQQLWRKEYGRRAYHMVYSFDDMEVIMPSEAMDIALLISSLFFPTYQVLFGVHTGQKHLHIHFAINTVSLADGRKLLLGYPSLRALREVANQITQQYGIYTVLEQC